MTTKSPPEATPQTQGSREGTPRWTHYGAMNDEQKEYMHDRGVIGTYDVEGLLTWRVFTHLGGTAISKKMLWIQTGLLALLFWGVYAVFFVWRPKDFSELVGKESAIRAFIAMFSTLIGLLLSFYTALNLGRWWQMRMGVEQVQEGCKKLVVMMYTGVTENAMLLDNINRYARASLYLIFATSQYQEGQEAPVDKAVAMDLLTPEEKEKLVKLSPYNSFVHAETLWVWLAKAVTMCHDQGLTKGPPHYCALMAAIDQGRHGITMIQAHLETPIPFGYVHMLCMMVQLHNFIMTVLMALTCVKNSGGEKGMQPVSMFRTAFRAFFMPFLYNAILILNAQVSDPFSGDDGDFDWNNYDVSIKLSTKAFAKASEHLPDWVSKEKFAPVKKIEAVEQKV